MTEALLRRWLRSRFLETEADLRTATLLHRTEDSDKTRLAVAMAELNLRLARMEYFESILDTQPEDLTPSERQYGAALIRESGVFKPER